MQIDALIFYAHDGRERRIEFNPGKLNVITGDSRTGKSSLINILRFCLGSGSPHAPHGPIREGVAWYGLLAHVSETHFFVGRPAPSGDATSLAMLTVGTETAPPFDELSANTNSDSLRLYLGGLLGIEDNEHLTFPGQTRYQLSADFVHSLYYCFQGQGEIANPDLLFHRQNREWQSQAIRDTLPYFLGAQGMEELRKRQELTELRRELRRAQQQLRAAQAERASGLDRAGSLLSEARDVGLAVAQDEPPTLSDARQQLRDLLDQANPNAAAAAPAGGEFEQLNRERRELGDQLREIAAQLRGLDEFAQAGDAYSDELGEQRARLATIGLVPEPADADATCAMCGQPLGEEHGTAHAAVQTALNSTRRRLDLAARDVPRIEAARDQLLEQRTSRRERLAEVNAALDAIASNDEEIARHRESLSLRSYVRGRIAQYLDSTQLVEDAELNQLLARVDQLTERVQRLEAQIDPDEVRSRVVSLLATISRQMSGWAKQLGLEHAEQGARIDIDRLTIVADTDQGPAYMDRGEIGSGMNWVGYHLSAYLALQQFFITRQRPVPRFLLLDQPSQAFFPRDRETGGDLEELNDTDRENTRDLYALMAQVVGDLDGQLQIIALDHADFEDPWFQDTVVQRWRDGEALIPREWLPEDASGDSPVADE
jgi:hypothetical protein